MKLSARSRRSRRLRRAIVAAGAALTFTAGIAGAQAGFFGVSATMTVTQTIALPVVPTTYHSVAGGAATAYTPNLQGGTVTVSVTSSAGNIGAIVADSDFSCPSNAPNPVASIRLAGGSGSVTVTARIAGTSMTPDGNLVPFDTSLAPGQVQASANGMELYSVCSA
jgi:hypothetical protein